MRYLRPEDIPLQADALADEHPACAVTQLGLPALVALRVGHGPRVLAVKGNAHADEPSGTVTCFAFARWLLETDAGDALAERFTFHLLPSANPDGLSRNRGWLDTPGDLLTWFREVDRDPPEQDREFGYGETPEQAAHPENAAWHRYLEGLPRLDGYLSLHSMAISGGAWFLALLDDLERRRPLLTSLERVAEGLRLPLHDEDRGGRKGFTRLAPGFCTAPTREEMLSFFAASGLGDEAPVLRLNSMQVAARLGCPVALVSELPQWWTPELADMTQIPERRARLDRRLGQTLEATLGELDALLAGSPPNRERIEAERRHRLGTARALAALADTWGHKLATVRDSAAAELQVLRAEAVNAQLAGDNDELARRVAAISARFALRELPLADQVAAQQGMIVALAEHVEAVG